MRVKGILFSSNIYQIDGLDVMVNFWIAPGDVSHRIQSTRFLSKTAGNIVMLDVSRANTLPEARTWLIELDKQAEINRPLNSAKRKLPTIILGNKMDLSGENHGGMRSFSITRKYSIIHYGL